MLTPIESEKDNTSVPEFACLHLAGYMTVIVHGTYYMPAWWYLD